MQAGSCQAEGCDAILPTDPQWYPARQSLRLDPSEYSRPLGPYPAPRGDSGRRLGQLLSPGPLSAEGKSLKDEDVLQKLPVGTTATLYFRDLGAQISWVTVSPDPSPSRLCHHPHWGDYSLCPPGPSGLLD